LQVLPQKFYIMGVSCKNILFLFAFAFLISGCDLRSPDVYLQDASQLAEQGNYQEAIKLLDKAIKKDKKFREAYVNKGFYYEQLKDYPSAIKTYTEVLQVDRKNTLALYGIASCKYDLKLYQESVDFYTKALQTKGYSPGNDSAGKYSAVIDYNKNGVFSITDAKFDVASNQIFYDRGIAYYQLRKLNEAYSDFSRSLNGNFYPAESQYMIALCYLESGNTELGCRALDKAIAMGDTLSFGAKQTYCK
jgi:tetratricopeptide (TPR) repeat protein